MLDNDTIHMLFPNLIQLIQFQRKFLIKLEMIAESPWEEQRWGHLFEESVSIRFRQSLFHVSSLRL